MALLDNGLKQRIVGALVLLALAVIFLPMILTGENEPRYVHVDPPAPPVVSAPPVIVEEQAFAPAEEWVIEPAPSVSVEPPVSRLDAQNLPVSWSIQVASLSSYENAQSLQNSLRNQGYSAYIRQAKGMHRVFVGPFIERKEADRVRHGLNQHQRLNGFVVRFTPEAN